MPVGVARGVPLEQVAGADGDGAVDLQQLPVGLVAGFARAQQTAADFAGVQALPVGGWILITANNPTKVFIYSSVIDNHTSDPTYHLADVK